MRRREAPHRAVRVGQMTLELLYRFVPVPDEQAAEISDRGAVIELEGTLEQAATLEKSLIALQRHHGSSNDLQLRPQRCPGVANETLCMAASRSAVVSGIREAFARLLSRAAICIPA